jgi:hypothetical protein
LKHGDWTVDRRAVADAALVHSGFELPGISQISRHGALDVADETEERNGVAFRQAMVFDFSANKQYQLPAVAPGQEIDLAEMKFGEIWMPDRRPNAQFAAPYDFTRPETIPPFSVAEVPYDGFQILNTGQMFAGLSDEPLPGADVEPAAVDRSAISLTLVYLGDR